MKKFFYLIILSSVFIFIFSLVSIKESNCEEMINIYNNKENKIYENIQTTKTLNVEEMHKKVVFLTFDDGPSYENTNKILEILNEEKVKASFFVVGNNLKSHPNTINKMRRYEMDILPHCNNHDYKEIYKNKQTYLKDLDTCIEYINNVTDNSFNKISRKFVRFPGGSDNQVSKKYILEDIKQSLLEEDINYIDWNVSSQDALAFLVPQDTIVSNIKRTGEYWNIGVVLFHDSEVKKSTPKALPEIIRFYKDRGYIFKKISEMNVNEFNYLVKNRVINRN